MKRKRVLMRVSVFIFAAILANPFTASAQKKFTLSNDVGKNQFEWTSTAPGETITGTAEGISGWISFDPTKPNTVTGTVSASVNTMKTGNDGRDNHLRGETWLDANKYPTISFTAKKTSNIKQSGNKYIADIAGDFTMHGVTKSITVPLEVQYIKASAETAKRAPGDLVSAMGTFTVSLADFGIKGKEGVIGSKVAETISIKAKLFGSSGLK